MWSSPVFKLFRCAGFYPVVYERNSNLFISSYVFVIINFVYFVLNAIGAFTLLPSFEEDIIFTVVNHLTYFASFFALAFITTSPVFQQKNICFIFNSILKVDKLLNKIGVFTDNRKIDNRTYVAFGLMLGLTVASCCVEICYPMWSLLGWTFWFYTIICLGYLMFLTSFFYVTYHLKTRFEMLNRHLEEMIEKCDKNKLFVVSCNYYNISLV